MHTLNSLNCNRQYTYIRLIGVFDGYFLKGLSIEKCNPYKIWSFSRYIDHCEGWNHAFSKLVGHSHPSIWRLVSHLKEDEAMSSTAIQKESRGEPPQKRTRKTTKDLQKKLLYLCESRSNGEKSIEKFLGVGHCIRLY